MEIDGYSRNSFYDEHLDPENPTVAWAEIPPIDDFEFWHVGNDPRLIGKYLIYAFNDYNEQYIPTEADYCQWNLNNESHGFGDEYAAQIFAWAYIPEPYKAPKKSAPTGTTVAAVMNHFERGD